MNADLHRLGTRLVGRWTTESTHPALPGGVMAGWEEIAWLDGEQFLTVTTHTDHPEIPDALGIIGDTDGLQMHYFDSRGVHRVYGVTATDRGWDVDMPGDAPETSFAPGHAPFSQQIVYRFVDDDTIAGLCQLSDDGTTWTDDLEITLRRDEHPAT